MRHKMYSILYTWIFCLAITSICSCEEHERMIEDSGRRIIGGVPVSVGDAPYQAGLANKMGKQYSIYCGAVIVQRQTVFTAIHCFEKYFPGLRRRIKGVTGDTQVLTQAEIPEEELNDLIIVAGTLLTKGKLSNDTKEGMQWSRIEKIVYQENYQFPLVADICVVHLKEPFTLNKDIKFIRYPSETTNYTTAAYCKAMGFGKLQKRDKVFSEILMQVNVSIMSNFRCSSVFDLDMQRVICSYTGEKDMSDGDAGGPLVCFKTVHQREDNLGILVGLGCGRRDGVASFYTRLSSYPTFLEPYVEEKVTQKAERHTITILFTVYLYFITHVLEVN